MNKDNVSFDAYSELGIITLKSFEKMGAEVDRLLLKRHGENIEFTHGLSNGVGELPESFLVSVEEARFSNGEGKVKLGETVRGKDIYVLCDVGNYSCSYEMHGYVNRMSPDDHFQDIKRVLSAIGGKSRRTTVIMPLLYASRQHKRKSRESLDCAMALQELENMGIKDIITFDVHDTSIQNAIPLVSFENIYATFDIVKAILQEQKDIIEKGKMLVISPDTGAMDRAIYYSGLLEADVGLFYKRRDYTKIIKGKNPIVKHEYMGPSVEGQTILIVDDMISSGESVFDIVVELKKRKAGKIFVATTFGLFAEGFEKFDMFYEQAMIDKVYTTNLSYLPEHLKEKKWFSEVGMAPLLAKLIDYLNHGKSLKPLLDDDKVRSED